MGGRETHRTSGGTRNIARAAVRAQLAHVACDLFRREGFDRVTVNDLAAAAGVSRSTFLRYFATKEDAVLAAFEAHGQLLATALEGRPAEEEDWVALRRALDALTVPYRDDPTAALEITRMVRQTPALRARNLDKQHTWRPALATVLARRSTPPRGGLAPDVLAAAALDCLNIALEHWTASDGRRDLEELLDEAFDVLARR